MLKNSFKILYQQFLTFLSFMNIFQKQPFADVLENRCSKKFCNVLNYKESPTQVLTCEYYEILKNSFFAGGCFCIILKVINQLFHKG